MEKSLEEREGGIHTGPGRTGNRVWEQKADGKAAHPEGRRAAARAGPGRAQVWGARHRPRKRLCPVRAFSEWGGPRWPGGCCSDGVVALDVEVLAVGNPSVWGAFWQGLAKWHSSRG